MNSLKVNEMVYKFQDLVEQKKVKTFAEFQNEIYLNFIIYDENHKSYKFVSYELKKMHAFLKKLQHHPNSHLLAQALKPMFRMLVNSIIIPKIVFVDDEKSGAVMVKYADLISVSSGRRLIQKTCDSFVIPYRGRGSTKNNNLINLGMKPKSSWLALSLGTKIYENMLADHFLKDEVDRIIINAEGGFIDKNSREFIELADKLHEFYLKSD